MGLIAAAPGVVSRPEIHGGRPSISGTGVTVHEIVARSQRGLTPEEIVLTAPHLGLDGILAALAYYDAHREEIEADFVADEELAAAIADHVL